MTVQQIIDGAESKEILTFAEWSFTYRCQLRELYESQLIEMGHTEEEIANKQCISYVDFQEMMFEETTHFLSV